MKRQDKNEAPLPGINAWLPHESEFFGTDRTARTDWADYARRVKPPSWRARIYRAWRALRWETSDETH